MTPQKQKQINLRIPGPTPVPPDILEAVGHPMINHRGGEFSALVSRITAHLKAFFLTPQDVMVLTCSGTGGPEAAVETTARGSGRMAVMAGLKQGASGRFFDSDGTEIPW